METNQTDPLASLNPTPQTITGSYKAFALGARVTLIIGATTDAHAVNVVRRTLQDLDMRVTVQYERPDETTTDTVIWIGGPTENGRVIDLLAQQAITGPEALPRSGYVLTASAKTRTIMLTGKDQTGTYYAAQTFKQLVQTTHAGPTFPELTIRDWPDMPLRGIVEGFYGPPWSHEERLQQLAFYGEQKFNTYIYAPKDDPYHREFWRDPYPDEALRHITALINYAAIHHVNFTFSLSPGLDISYASDADFAALMNKMTIMWDLGVRSFAIFLDDIDKVFHTEADRLMFQNEIDPIAAAHAHLLNRFNDAFIKERPEAERLIMVPTDYSGGGTSVYREQFGSLLDEDILVMWTGEKVVAEEITATDVAEMHNIFNHDLLLWDNYPVNDHDRDNLFIAPLIRRDKDLAAHGVHGLTANPMNEAEASKIPLYTIADYTWNQAAYDPDQSFARSLAAFAGDAAPLLRSFAENAYSSPLSDTEALTLQPLITTFWQAYVSDAQLSQAADALLAEFSYLRTVPSELRATLDNEAFLTEIAGYLNKLESYALAGEAAVQYLLAVKAAETENIAAHRETLVSLFNEAQANPKKLGQGVIEPFLIMSALATPPLEMTVQPALRAFSTAQTPADRAAASDDVITRFAEMKQTAEAAQVIFTDPVFAKAIQPYVDNLTVYSEAGRAAVAYRLGDEAARTTLRTLMVDAYKGEQVIGHSVITPFLIDTRWPNETVISYRELDGVDVPRGGGVLIHYTPEYGTSTKANHWGYEITVVDDRVVQRGGNDCAIPEHGYVLSIHGSDWLRDFTTIGTTVRIEDGLVLMIAQT